MPAKNIGTLLSFRMSVTVAGVLLVAGVIFVALFIRYPAHRGEIGFAAAVCGGLAGIYSAYYAGAALRQSVEHSAKQQAFAYSQRFNSIDIARVRGFIERNLNRKDIKPSEFHAKVIENQELHVAVKALLGFLEELAIGVQEHYADEKCAFRYFGFAVPYTFNNLYGYIETEREICRDNGIYSEAQRLANCWREGKSILTGQALS
jgi:hypothetical protein